jgi:hypothetical protein
MKKPIIFLLLISSFFAFGQKRSYTTQKIRGTAPKIDGIIDEKAWEMVEWAGEFTQWMPANGAPPTESTEFKIIYDDNYLYVAIKALDSEPDKIVKRMSRRDGFEGDFVEVNIDSYHDFLTAYSFSATAAGVKGDEKISQDGENWDPTWDPIWYLKTSFNEQGWIAEIKIPMTQLRFSEDKEQVWGLEVKRMIHRLEERSVWAPIDNTESGYVSRFGELRGIHDIKPKKQMDVTPYAVGSYEHYEKEEGNPFSKGEDWKVRGGVDAKIGLSNNITMDLTINPDFGQVEADPSEVNLSGFESYFREQRPFFIEGRNIYQYPTEPGDGDGSVNNLFYSRRIGRQPYYYPDYDYVNQPQNTRILGAAKITGKTRKGLSIGILESVTNKENAEFINDAGSIEKIAVEPMTNYFAARLEQDMNKGNTIIGGMFTATNRFIKEDHLNELPSSAYSGGINFEHNWSNRKYTISAKLLGSHVSGDTAAMMQLQTSNRRLFQRPDVKINRMDSTRTSLSGHGGFVSFSKNKNSGWRYMGWVSWLSPGLELNDIGFLRQTDNINQVFWIGYSTPQPLGIFRKINVNFSEWMGWNFDGLFNSMGINTNTFFQFKNFWQFYVGANYNSANNSDSHLRGGPVYILPQRVNLWAGIETNDRKKLRFEWDISRQLSEFNYRTSTWTSLEITYQAIDRLKMSLETTYGISQNRLQYLSEEDVKNNNEYFLAEINQETLMMELRLNYSFTPDLSLQYYGQPFISSGKYSNYKRVSNSTSSSYYDRYELVSPDADNNLDLDGNGEIDVEFGEPDFKYIYFQSNMVLRWEYLPGSTLFVVWTQSRDEGDYNLDQLPFEFDEDFNRMFRIFPHDIFLVKLSYRIPI